MGIIRENGVERDFLRDSLYRQGDQVIAKNIIGATKFNTDLLPFTLVLYYVLLVPLVPFTECSRLACVLPFTSLHYVLERNRIC